MTEMDAPAADDAVDRPAIARLALGVLGGGDGLFRAVLDALPAAIYVTDASGRLIYFNPSAVALWGLRPKLGETKWCGSWKLYWPDGRALPHAECPMATALKEARPVRGLEAVVERPDGTRAPVIPFPTPLFEASGALVGAVNMMVDVSDRKAAGEMLGRLAAIVESSEDAIISKDLDGVITSWNQGAERLFGYTSEEAIGQPVMMLIPTGRRDEEATILARIRAGGRMDHYETTRQRKDGGLVEISLSVSPIRGADGAIVGASKVARDITERLRAREQQQLLLREMDHRVKNLFTLANSVVSLSARSAATPGELAAAVGERLSALARAHSLTLAPLSGGARPAEQGTTLHALIRTIVSPYDGQAEAGGARVAVSGSDVPLAGRLVTNFALLLHEFATNAAKYGALSTPAGQVEVTCWKEGDQFLLEWQEKGGPPVQRKTDGDGFGSLIARATVKGDLGGEISREWKREGLTIRLSIPLTHLGD